MESDLKNKGPGTEMGNRMSAMATKVWGWSRSLMVLSWEWSPLPMVMITGMMRMNAGKKSGDQRELEAKHTPVVANGVQR